MRFDFAITWKEYLRWLQKTSGSLADRDSISGQPTASNFIRHKCGYTWKNVLIFGLGAHLISSFYLTAFNAKRLELWITKLFLSAKRCFVSLHILQWLPWGVFKGIVQINTCCLRITRQTTSFHPYHLNGWRFIIVRFSRHLFPLTTNLWNWLSPAAFPDRLYLKNFLRGCLRICKFLQDLGVANVKMFYFVIICIFVNNLSNNKMHIHGVTI